VKKYKIVFLPEKIEIEVRAGASILEAAGEAGVELDGPCGGKGTCGKCRVRLIDHQGAGHWVLACRTPIESDLIVEISQLEISLHRKNELSLADVQVSPDAGIMKRTVMVEAPSLSHQDPDDIRCAQALEEPVAFKLETLRSLPQAVRKRNQPITAVIADHQVIAVEEGDTSNRMFGLAVDIGTTTVVVALMNLQSGETMAIASATNPQSTFGADVIARIEHAMNYPNGLEKLHHRVIHTINRLTRKLSLETKVDLSEIYQVTVVGNTTMSHLFLKLDPTYLASAPFTPVTSSLVQAEAGQIGLEISPHAPVYVTPNIAGYVGGDTVGVIMSTGIYQLPGTHLAIDIGTNGEIVLAHNGKLVTCSTAAGPAFEGAQIKQGMRAASGAIEGVKIDGRLQIKTIGNVKAKGICGSGLMDAIAELVRIGVIEPGGRMISREEAAHLPPDLRSRLGSDESGTFFILAFSEEAQDEAVVLTQKDVRELQLAKGAIRAGIQVLLEHMSLTHRDIDQALLAGAFGSYINKASALGIGLLPPIPGEKIKSVGNAAGAGARMALISKDIRERSTRVARNVEHLELSGRMDFQGYFVEYLSFKLEK